MHPPATASGDFARAELGHSRDSIHPTAHAPSSLSSHNVQLKKPVVIPRIDVKGLIGVPPPFTRAYSPYLQSVGISVNDFVAFIDDLSIAQAPPAPLQALDVAGHVVGSVPHHWAMIAGASMNMAAGVGTAAATTMRSQRFLELANKQLFAPRGLKVSVCKHKSLMERLGCDPFMISRTASESSAHGEMAQRCLSTLAPLIAPLDFNVPAPAPQRNALDMMAAKQIERRRMKKEHSLYKDSDSDAISSSSSSSDSSSERSIKHACATTSGEPTRKERKKLEKQERRRRKAERKSARKAKKAEKQGKKPERQGKREERQRKKLAKMEYIVVEFLAEYQ